MKTEEPKIYYLYVVCLTNKEVVLRASRVNIVDLYRIITEWYLNFEDEILKAYPKENIRQMNLNSFCYNALDTIIKMWYISEEKDFEPDEDFFERYREIRKGQPEITWKRIEWEQ